MEQINLNLIPNGTKPVCHVSQYDNGRQFRVNLFDGTSVYSLAGTETIELSVKKTDGTIYTSQITNTSTTYLLISTATQMCAAPGENRCELKITNSGIILGTLNFILDVEEDPLVNGVESQSSIYDLRQQIEDIISHMPPSGGGMKATKVELFLSEYTVIQ